MDSYTIIHLRWDIQDVNMYVNGKTDSTADSDSMISVNHRNRVRDGKNRFPLFLSVLELVTAGSDTAARTLILRHELRVRGAEFESAVTNSVPVVNVSYTYQCSTLVQHWAVTARCLLPAALYPTYRCKRLLLYVIIALALHL
jgi:hypothetical protein